jgi:hypothetical protein
MFAAVVSSANIMITDNDETAYREEVRDLAVWCQDNNISLNMIMTKR